MSIHEIAQVRNGSDEATNPRLNNRPSLPDPFRTCAVRSHVRILPVRYSRDLHDKLQRECVAQIAMLKATRQMVRDLCRDFDRDVAEGRL